MKGELPDSVIKAAVESWWRRLSTRQQRAHIAWVGDQTELQTELQRAKNLTPRENQWQPTADTP